MKVQILLEETWIGGSLDKMHRFAFSYEDTKSAAPVQAAERAWLITNGAIQRLDEEDLRLRQQWEASYGGHTVSVGDIVIVDDVPYSCAAGGWEKVSVDTYRQSRSAGVASRLRGS